MTEQPDTKELTVIYDTPRGEIKLTPAIIKKYLVRGDPQHITDQEIAFFMKLCEFQQLNPWLNEAYIIKYGTAPATLVTGIEAFLKRASRNKKYRGHKVSCLGEVPDITAVAEVYVEGFFNPVSVEVEYKEYVGKKKDGTINKMWAGKPKTMTKKVALCQALRQAFPEDLGGLYTEEESGDGLVGKPASSFAEKMKQGADAGVNDAGNPSKVKPDLFQVEETLPAITIDQLKKLSAVLEKNNLSKKEAYIDYINKEYKLNITEADELSSEMADRIIKDLEV